MNNSTEVVEYVDVASAMPSNSHGHGLADYVTIEETFSLGYICKGLA